MDIHRLAGIKTRVMPGHVFVTFVTALLAASTVPCWAASAKDTVNQIAAIISNTNDPATLSRRLDGRIDYPTIAKESFTPQQWAAFNPSQRAQITASLRTLITNRYYGRWHKIFTKGNLAISDEASSGGFDFIRSYLKHGKQQDILIWKLNGNRLVDLTVNGKDLTNRLAERAQPVLVKQGPTKFLVWLKDQSTGKSETAEASEREDRM